jgi:hypothetical protein
MKINDPRAAGFNEAGFRDAIKFAMQMGLPEDESLRATFVWSSKKSFASADRAGRPYSFDAEPLSEQNFEAIQVDCAVQWVDRSAQADFNAIGSFDSPRAVLTLLDVDFDKIQVYGVSPDKVLLGGSTYNIQFTEPPVGLFGVTVHRIHIRAEDESYG